MLYGCLFSTNGFIVVYVHPDGGLCVTDGLFGHVDTPVVLYVHPDGGLSVTDGLFGHIDTPVDIFIFSGRKPGGGVLV